MWKKVLAILLVVVVLVVVACDGGAGEVAAGEEGAGLPPAEEIVAGVIEAWGGVRTQEFVMEMAVEVAGEDEEGSFEMMMEMSFSGALDIENEELRAEVSVAMAMPEEEAMAMAMYVVGDTGYVKMDMPEMGPVWMKRDLSAAGWGEISEGIEQTEAQIELLRTAQVEVLGSEEVGGVDCYLLKLVPDKERLWEAVMGEAEVADTEIPDVAEEYIREILRDVSVRQWIAKDTYFLVKAEIEMGAELTPAAMGYAGEEGEATMEVTMSLLCYNYNQPVSIVLPAEAEDAVEMPNR